MLSVGINPQVALHNIYILSPSITVYIINTYGSSSRFIIARGAEFITSQEGTTQEDPIVMPWYSMNTTMLIQFMRNQEEMVRQVWLVDDAAARGKLERLHSWYNLLIVEGGKTGYYVNNKKCWLIVKSTELALEAHKIFGETEHHD